MWLEWTPLLVFQRIRTNIYTSIYFAENFFLNLPEDSKYCRNLVIFSSLLFVIFFNFVVSLTNLTYMEVSKTLPDIT